MMVTEKRSRRWLVGLAAAGCVAGLVALFCCGPRSERPSTTASDAAETTRPATSDPESPSPTVVSRMAVASATADSVESDAGTTFAPPGEASAPSRNPIAAAVGRDPRDLELLSQIERELRRDPPPEVHALLSLRARGATRDELIAFVRQRFPADLPLRAVALRWVERVAPAPGGAKAEPPPTASGSSLVRPLEKAP